MDNDGLNSLKYSVENLTEHRLYTLISVDVKEAMLQYETESTLPDESASSGFFYDIAIESSGDKNEELFTIYWQYLWEFFFTENHISQFHAELTSRDLEDMAYIYPR